MAECGFQGISVPERQRKPRTLGLTMMIDWGMPPGQQDDVVAASSYYIDKVKIAAGIPRFMPWNLLKAKLAAYCEVGISTANGGLFTELTLQQGSYEVLLQNLVEVGFDAVEVSENLVPLSAREKSDAVRTARQVYGLRVLGEVGRKEGSMTDDEIIQDVEIYLEAGVESVYLEAAEIFSGSTPRENLIGRLSNNFPPEALIFELPVTVLPGVTRDMKHKTAAHLVQLMGTEVNLANVEHDELYLLECIRRGLAGDTSHPGGAYRLAGIGNQES